MKLIGLVDSVPVSNRGLSYGDGFFETLLFKEGRCALLKHHMARLCNTASALGMPISQEEVVSLVDYLKENILDASNDQLIKILVTREAGGRGYRSLQDADAEIYIQAYAYSQALSEDLLEAGVRLRTCKIRLSQQPALAGLKHLNRLENVLARNEWRDDLFFEGLLLDQNGLVIEATQSNVFFKIGSRWLTPELNQCGVAGVMRAWLIDNQEQLNRSIHVTTLSTDDLAKATSCFICNSVLGIVPVQSIDFKEQTVSFDLDEPVLLLNKVRSVLS